MRKIDASDEVWIWVHQKYGMSQIVRKLYSFETNNCSYLYVPVDDQLNRRNNEAYNLQCTNSKIMMTVTIISNCIIMHCIINMNNSKQQYRFRQKNLTYLDYDEGPFNNEECEFKVKMLLVMW